MPQSPGVLPVMSQYWLNIRKIEQVCLNIGPILAQYRLINIGAKTANCRFQVQYKYVMVNFLNSLKINFSNIAAVQNHIIK